MLVPFLYRIHGHPDDYHRHTASGWNLILERAGVPSSGQRIRPLVWDPLSTAWAIADIAPLGRLWSRARRVMRTVVLGRPLYMSAVDARPTRDALRMIDYPVAYAIAATKPE